MNVNIIFSILSLTFICEVTNSANILAVVPSPFYSHQATFRPIWRELARRGHKLTLITTDSMEPNENITQIDYSEAYKVIENLKNVITNNTNVFKIMTKFIGELDTTLTRLMAHPELVALVKRNEKFDLLFIEMLATPFTALSCKFNAPYIGITTMDAHLGVHGSIGNSIHPAIYPFTELGYIAPLTFKERIISTVVTVVYKTLGRLVLAPLANKVVDSYIAKGCTTLEDKTSLLFINANPVIFPPRPITPTTINLGGGLHFKKPEKLPTDIQEFLDQSQAGCIYFSFGSTINSNTLKQETIEVFRKTFEDLAPITILWKYENETLPNKPVNLLIKKWLPQQDVLRHPNIRLFITQGGLQSIEEAIENAVPMLAMPFYGDQIYNSRKILYKHMGLTMNVDTLTQVDLKNNITEILQNSTYKQTMQKYSKILKDRPMNALETAVWWTEYLLRHGDTSHLRSPSADIPLYQYFFLDIMAFLLVLLIFITILIYYAVKVIRHLVTYIFRKKSKEKLN